MNDVLLTFDIDWAPDVVIDYVADELVKRNIKATWFVTHSTPSVSRLKEHSELFELGIHPNFLPGSTHGNTPEEVLSHCLSLVPEAISMRSHGLVQSTHLLNTVLLKTPIMIDACLFLPYTPNLCLVEYWWNKRRLFRIPFFWEDDYEMQRDTPCWTLQPLLAIGAGLKVFNFHPIHVYLNSKDMQPYSALKQSITFLSEATFDHLTPFVHQGQGTRSLFLEIVDYLAESSESYRIIDIYKHSLSA